MTISPPKNLLDHFSASDIRGIAQLATEATVGVTRIAEGLHRSVWDTIGLPGGHTPGRTRGITGLVYASVRGVTRLVDKSIAATFDGLHPWLESAESPKPGTPQREALLAALNGVMGDRLVASRSPFAIPMTLRYQRQELNWQALPPMPEATSKVLLLIHGLCVNDVQSHGEHRQHVTDHGEALTSALGYTPVYLRYNSGLHISQNGHELSNQLERLVRHWPVAIEELAVVAHSMGGLLIRSAIDDAEQRSLHWLGQLSHIAFLGTPHHGAPLERAGNWLDVILGSTPYSAPFTKLSQLRSSGITDLRYGYVTDGDWQDHDRFHRRPDTRQVVPLPKGVACHTFAATTAAKRSTLTDRLTGDGLVPLRSALGEHDDPRRTLAFAKESQWIAYRMGHMELLSSPEVTRQLVRWLASTKARETALRG